MPHPFHPRAGAVLLVVLALGAGCNDDGNRPHRSPTQIDIPLDMSLVEAVRGAVPGDTLNILSAPFLPLADPLVVGSDQTPLLIRGEKAIPVLSTLNQGPIFRFESPKMGTRISRVGFAGGAPTIEVSGGEELTIDNATFAGGTVQVFGSGTGLKITMTRALLRQASQSSLEMAGGAVLVASNLTIAKAGANGVLLRDGASARITNTIIWQSGAYGVACDGDDLLDGSGCNDINGNQLGSYLQCTAPDTTNFDEDPAFCDPGQNVYTIPDISYCSPLNSQGCGLIGAMDVGVCTP